MNIKKIIIESTIHNLTGEKVLFEEYSYMPSSTNGARTSIHLSSYKTMYTVYAPNNIYAVTCSNVESCIKYYMNNWAIRNDITSSEWILHYNAPSENEKEFKNKLSEIESFTQFEKHCKKSEYPAHKASIRKTFNPKRYTYKREKCLEKSD